MKKFFIGIALFGGVFILSGCGSKALPQKDSASGNQQAQQGSAQNESQAPQIQPIGSPVKSIKEVMESGKLMKCSYSLNYPNGTLNSIAYINGKKFRVSEILGGGITQNRIFDGDTGYSWQEGKKTGDKLSPVCLSDAKSIAPEDKKKLFVSPAERFDEAKNASCEQTNESVDFGAPSDVKFEDQCEAVKKSAEDMKNSPAPAGGGELDSPAAPAQQ